MLACPRLRGLEQHAPIPLRTMALVHHQAADERTDSLTASDAMRPTWIQPITRFTGIGRDQHGCRSIAHGQLIEPIRDLIGR